MPHSGGGGSHSGGSHGGGSRRSRSRRGGSGSSRSTIRISKRSFPGCRTYVLYKQNKPSRIIYTDRAYDTQNQKYNLISSSILLGIFAFFGLLCIIWGFLTMIDFGTQTIDPPSDNDIHIMDANDLVSAEDEVELKTYLKDFYDTTGVVPAVLFTYDDYWQNDYIDCEAFAYDQYIYNFSDEKHVLIVYSFGYVNSETNFNEFHWESMWGDNLGRAIKTNDENYFADSMQRNLSRSNGKDVAHAIGLSFDELTNYLTVDGVAFASSEEVSTGVTFIFFGVLFGGFSLLLMIPPIKKYNDNKDCEAYEVKNGMLQQNCEYCGCMYITGTISVCPHCGAAIPAFDPVKHCQS